MTAVALQAKGQNIPSLADLKAGAVSHISLSGLYAGDVSPAAAYGFLTANGGVLVDVRTPQEWQQVGVPDMAATRARFILLSWKTHPDFALNPLFVETITSDSSISKDTPLFFICRSGGRSLDAALAVAAQGYENCFNIEGGFEGNFAASSQAGWKSAQLPCKQG